MIKVDSIGMYEGAESLKTPSKDPVLEDPTNRAISIVVPLVERHGERIYHVEVDHGSMREEIRLLKDRVRELE